MNEDIERESNLALIELDKGLRATHQGDQVECVVSFSNVLSAHPFPIFVNSACLKLADCYNVSNNFVRLCIVQVFEESVKHLDKLKNVDEFLMRITQVVHSNDAVARAITLRCLAACSSILKDRKLVHHSILESLRSHDPVEVQASIHAVGKFAKVSQDFIAVALPALTDAIQNGSVSLKLQLIPILQYSSCNKNLSENSRALLLQLLKTYKSRTLVSSIIQTLTKLACQSPEQLPAQLKLLYDYLLTEMRAENQQVILKCIHAALIKNASLLTSSHVQILLDFAASNPSHTVTTLRILCEIITPATLSCFMDRTTRERINLFSLDACLKTAACSLKLSCLILSHIRPDKNGDDAMDGLLDWQSQVLDDFEALLLTAASAGDLTVFKSCILSLNLIGERYEPEVLHDILSTLLTSDISAAYKMMVCEFLMSKDAALPLILYEGLTECLTACPSDAKLLLLVCAVLFKPSHQLVKTQKDSHRLYGILSDILREYDFWTYYQLVRLALRYGQPYIATQLIQSHILPLVSREQHYIYLTILSHIATSFLSLEDIRGPGYGSLQYLTGLEEALKSLDEARKLSQMINQGDQYFSFHVAYLSSRYQLLSAQRDILHIANTYRVCPPPAIHVTEKKDDIQRWTARRDGPIAGLFKFCLQEFDQVIKQIECLERRMLDADMSSRAHVQRIREEALVSQAIVSSVFQRSPLPHIDPSHASGKLINRFKSTAGTSKAKDIDLLENLCIELITTSDVINLPRFFFQQLQHTSVTLNVTPSQKSTETVSNHNQTEFTIKVEGVVSLSHMTPRPMTRVNKVLVKLDAKTEGSGSQQNMEEVRSLKSRNSTDEIHQQNLCDLVNDFYTTDFVLKFKETGTHNMIITCLMEDSYSENLWDICCSEEIQMKSYREKKFTTAKLPV